MADLARSSAPMRGIRIVDDTDSLLRAPEVVFAAHVTAGYDRTVGETEPAKYVTSGKKKL